MDDYNITPCYFIYRDGPTDGPFDPTAPLQFYPPKDSDELFFSLKTTYPSVTTHSERMRNAVIDFLLTERACEQTISHSPSGVGPESYFDSQSISPQSSWQSTSSSSINSSPALYDNASPAPTVSSTTHRRESYLTPTASTLTPAMDKMTSVFSLSTNAETKTRTRRRMTEVEKVEYRKRRQVKACASCNKRKRKCVHNKERMETMQLQKRPSSEQSSGISSKAFGKRPVNSNAVVSRSSRQPQQTSPDIDLEASMDDLINFDELTDTALPQFSWTNDRDWTLLDTECNTAVSGQFEHQFLPDLHDIAHRRQLQPIQSASTSTVSPLESVLEDQLVHFDFDGFLPLSPSSSMSPQQSTITWNVPDQQSISLSSGRTAHDTGNAYDHVLVSSTTTSTAHDRVLASDFKNGIGHDRVLASRLGSGTAHDPVLVTAPQGSTAHDRVVASQTGTRTARDRVPSSSQQCVEPTSISGHCQNDQVQLFSTNGSAVVTAAGQYAGHVIRKVSDKLVSTHSSSRPMETLPLLSQTSSQDKATYGLRVGEQVQSGAGLVTLSTSISARNSILHQPSSSDSLISAHTGEQVRPGLGQAPTQDSEATRVVPQLDAGTGLAEPAASLSTAPSHSRGRKPRLSSTNGTLASMLPETNGSNKPRSGASVSRIQVRSLCANTGLVASQPTQSWSELASHNSGSAIQADFQRAVLPLLQTVLRTVTQVQYAAMSAQLALLVKERKSKDTEPMDSLCQRVALVHVA